VVFNDDASFVANTPEDHQMKPPLVLIAITLLIAPAITACTHTRPVAELNSTYQEDCQTLDDCGEDKNSHYAVPDQVKTPPTDHESLGAFPTAVNSQVT
jgi:hypothetical protein